MKSYTPASDAVRDRALALIKRFYPDLVDVQIRIDYIFVSTDTEDAPALTHGGYPAQAVVKILGPKERAMERGDAEIVIDEERWNELTDAEQDALLDHELYHLEVVKNKLKTRAKRDCCGRPVLKLRKHDRQFGWFDAIAARHGKASLEVKQFTDFEAETGQLYLGFGFREALESIRPKDDTTVSIRVPSANVGVTLSKDGATRTDGAGNPTGETKPLMARPCVQTRDGRTITPNEMLGEIKEHFAPAAPEHRDDVKAELIGEITEAHVDAAWRTVCELDRASVATLQRRLRIGYNRGFALLNELEKRGIVGPDTGNALEPREILKPYEQQAAA